MITATEPLDRRSDSADSLKAATRRILSNCGIPVRPSWVHRTVCRYVNSVAHTGFPFGPWLVAQIQLTSEQHRRAMANPEIASILCYADPVGETAIRNVMRADRG